MTTYNHTAIVNGDSRGNDKAIWNDPLSALDSAIGNLAALSTIDKSSAVAAANELRTLMNTAISAATVDSEVVTARSGETVLLDRLTAIGANRINAKSTTHGATGDGSTDDTTALLSALDVAYTTIVSGSGTSITVASAVAFSDGDDIEITQDDDTIHKTTVSGAPAGNVITLTDTLTDTVTAGNLVIQGIDKENTNDGSEVELPPGTYIITRPLPWNRSMAGSRLRKTIIKAHADFVGGALIDMEDAAQYMHMSNLTLDTNNVTGVQCLGSDTGTDGAVGYFSFIEFKNVEPGSYAIGAALSSGTGMFAGAVFINCSWQNCAQWIYLGASSDDVTFLNCRFFQHASGPAASNFYVDIYALNVRFQSCYFVVGVTSNVTKNAWRINSQHVVVENCFFEEVSDVVTDLDAIFYCGTGNERLAIKNCVLYLRGASTTLDRLVSIPGLNDTTDRAKVEIKNVWNTGSAGSIAGIALLHIINSGGAGSAGFVELELGGNSGWDDAPWTITTNSTAGSLVVHGVHNGIDYSHRIISSEEYRVGPLLEDFRVRRTAGQYVKINSDSTASYVRGVSVESAKKPLYIASSHDGTGGAAGTNNIVFLSGALGSEAELARLTGATKRLSVATTGSSAMIQADQSDTSGAVPVLMLDQADESEGFIDFIGTSAASATGPVSTWTTGGAIAGFVRVEINGVAYWMPFYTAPTA